MGKWRDPGDKNVNVPKDRKVLLLVHVGGTWDALHGPPEPVVGEWSKHHSDYRASPLGDPAFNSVSRVELRIVKWTEIPNADHEE